MEFFFQDPNEKRLPPSEVRIRKLEIEPWKDGRRIHVSIEVDPFQQRPNFELTITDSEGNERASVSILESITTKTELTMHIKGSETSGRYTFNAQLFFMEKSPAVSENESDNETLKPYIVDEVEKTFQITSQLKEI
jgi:hypothetical protein